MLDIKWIRDNKEEFDSLLQKRGVKINSDELLALDKEKKKANNSNSTISAIEKC